jgi:hypothetical protein
VIVHPLGNDGPDQVYGETPPDAVKVPEYACPVASVSTQLGVKLSVTAGFTVMESDALAVSFCGADESVTVTVKL